VHELWVLVVGGSNPPSPTKGGVGVILEGVVESSAFVASSTGVAGLLSESVRDFSETV
jgi:hypothetical protein